LSFLGVLLAVSYIVPYIAEQTQYAITRGKQRAEYEFAQKHLDESPIREMSRAYQMVSQAVGPSVVHISTQGSEPAMPLVTTRGRGRTEGQGSGIVMDEAGYVLTNNHVVKGVTDIQVSLADGRKVRAVVIGRDGPSDLAVLKIDSDNLVPAKFGDSDGLEPGALVWAVGSPFGLAHTVTAGILSAKHRAWLAGNSNQDFLQTDAAVNPGNSGGPLVDASGKVIGINTAIVGDAYQGISFAIPSNAAIEIYNSIKKGRGWLGVHLEEMNAERAKQIGASAVAGVYIAGIYVHENRSPAAVAGIQPGDVLLKWNETMVNTPSELRRLVEKTTIGSKTKVVVLRDSQELTLEVVVGRRPAELPVES
jgi:serine protease Do